MKSFSSLIFMPILLYILAVHTKTVIQAAANSNRSLDLSFVLKQNQTGHYITHWAMKNDFPKPPTNMKIDFKSSITEYGGIHTFNIHGILTVPPTKPADYELFPGIGYYKFYPDGVQNYYQASTTCTNDGGHLAIVNSDAENNALQMLFGKYPKAKGWAYIGFHDMEVEGKYVTIFGEPLVTTSYLQWNTGQPDQGDGNEDCGSFGRNGKINDLWCDKKGPWPFICEYDLSWNE